MSHSPDEASKEARSFPVPQGFQERAHVRSKADYESLYAQSLKDPEAFWHEQTKDLVLRKSWDRFASWELPNARFFEGAKLNITESCLDRHLATEARNRAAILFEGEPGDTRTLTYFELHREVVRLAAALADLGVSPGDRVAIYMGMVPETAMAMLACARLGATHSVVFGGFSSDALRDRLNDCGAKILLTQDGAYRRGSIVPLKQMADAAVEGAPTVEKVIVLQRVGAERAPVTMKEGRDVWWSDLLARPASATGLSRARAPEAFDAEHPLFILYTSGSTGRPKGVLHTTAGYLAGAHVTTRLVFDVKPSDLYWCTADVGWVTGHSYIVYGPLSVGASVLLYEGAPNWPDPARFWRIIERHGVTIFYTAPTAIRAFIRWGDEHPQAHDLSSLRLLGSVGEPINPEAWLWYHRVIGGGRCPIVDTWWQTETGAIMLTTLPGAVPAKPGATGLPFFGVDPAVVKDDGTEVPAGESGKLVIRRPWPSMARTLWKDPERYATTYWKPVPGVYFTGDGARKDSDGYYWVVGRIDDVLNIAGHRIGTAEVESALVSHGAVAEAAAVGRPDELKGQALVVFVTLKASQKASKELKRALLEHIEREIGKFARPDEIRFTEALPKTRSGKIMRRFLREIASGAKGPSGDTSTLEDLNVFQALAKGQDEE
jgi:acetyl-CoA synthetase